jgi:protein pelota
MKLRKKDICNKNGEGIVVLIPEETEDMWHIYNLITEDDQVRATTFRKVVMTSSTGSSTSERKRVTLTLRVESVDFDPMGGVIRVHGRNVEENQHVKMGAYHTVDLEVNRKVQIAKPCWDAVFLERLETACDPSKTADLAAVVMQEGLAHVCLITQHMTIVRAKVECSIPKKRRGTTTQHDKGTARFYEAVMQALLRHVDFDVVKCCLIASPGFVKDDFFRFMYDQAARRADREKPLKALFEHKQKFVKCHAASGHKHALNEVLGDAAVMARMADTKAARETALLDRFFKMLNDEPDRAYYGYSHCRRAQETGAIETLLVSDSLFKSCDIKTRREYVALVEEVRDAGGEVSIFSAQHTSGEQLAQISGVAAILRFPLPDIESDEESEDSDGG